MLALPLTPALVLLYLLRFEGNRNLKLEECVTLLREADVPPELRKAVPRLLQYCGKGCPGRGGMRDGW